MATAELTILSPLDIVFYIGFTSAPRMDDEGRRHATGALTLGSDTESFQSDLGAWSMGDYERQWREAIARLLSGSPSSALITSFHGPAADSHVVWPCWRDGATVVFQQRLLFAGEFAEPFDPAQVYEIVGERVTIDEEGRRVSEWVVPLGHLANFLLDR